MTADSDPNQISNRASRSPFAKSEELKASLSDTVSFNLQRLEKSDVEVLT
jgi:hypothetical protein